MLFGGGLRRGFVLADMRGQCRGVMLLLEIMQCLPPELVRIDIENTEVSQATP
jgi:hypothetical protein